MADGQHTDIDDQDEVYLDLGRIGARWGALLVAFWFAVLFYGLIDLFTVPTQDAEFYDTYLLETGWGLLFTFLVPLPLVLFAVRPENLVHARQLIAVAVGIVLASIGTAALGQLVLGLFLALVGVLLLVVSGVRFRPEPGTLRPGALLRRVDPALGVLATVAVAGAIAYAVDLTRAFHGGEADDQTWHLDHLPMQAALGLSLAGAALVTAAAACRRSPGWRTSAVAPALSAGWLGVVSWAYPDHVGSLGTIAGVAAVVWALAFLGTALAVHRR